MKHKDKVSICWLRRDLRLEDQAALYKACKAKYPVVLYFIFDTNILDELSDRADPRVTFIYQQLQQLNTQLLPFDSSVRVTFGTPETCWPELLQEFDVQAVYTNHDYEPYAAERDSALAEYLSSESIPFYTFKDQVIFEKKEITKADGLPYTVFTPYFRQWKNKLNDFFLKAYPSIKYLDNTYKNQWPIIQLEEIGFQTSTMEFPGTDFSGKLAAYEEKRDYPAADATSHLGLHLRFGTVSIRTAAKEAIDQKAEKWLSELAWRDFYMMIMWHFPQTVTQSFKPAYDRIKWINDPNDFQAWKEGRTGYPIVDAGMRQLAQTGYMHNRVRMITASFLTKHLLIDWRWGEAWFAEKLLDYELASNVGGWQWACGCGNDAAPYFRVFSPELQTKKFDPDHAYINYWVPEYQQKKHVQPIVEHAFARERILRVFKAALNE